MPLSLITALSELPQALIEQFATGDGLLLTGAGVSRRQRVQDIDGEIIPVGVPSAADLEAHLRKWAPRPHPHGAGLEGLATIYAERRGRSRLDRLLRAAYLTRAQAPPFYQRIA